MGISGKNSKKRDRQAGEKTLDLPARSRFGEGRAQPLSRRTLFYWSLSGYLSAYGLPIPVCRKPVNEKLGILEQCNKILHYQGKSSI
jgi:hypothetical protein